MSHQMRPRGLYAFSPHSEGCGGDAAELALVEESVSKAPIVVPENAPPATSQAAGELAEYMEKISGARPEIVTGAPVPAPKHAIWVGFQPKLNELFPDTDFVFAHPEEILIVCNGDHVAITGRDRMLDDEEDGKQLEHGTANAVYAFLEKSLHVRWLWPGPLGEDIVRRKTVMLAPFEYRFHPPFRQRTVFTIITEPGAEDWMRFQRNALSSWRIPTGGHAYTDWWERFHEDHPEYFALQPDGTRTYVNTPETVKLCESNPEVWTQWLADTEERLRKDPTLNGAIAHPNDGHSTGICVCERCQSWDPPDAAPWTYFWRGVSQQYVAMTDRYIKFWNELGSLLKERFPNRELYVRGGAYGPSEPLPVKEVLADNVVMTYVGHFPLTNETARQKQKGEWKRWVEEAPHLIYRPNLWYWAGGSWGLPEVAMTKTIEDFRFLAETGCVGLNVDMAREHWATQGPQYYVMAQLAWDPLQDGRALLKDYYRRGFGDAAEDIEAYWTLMEEARETLMNGPDATFKVEEQILDLFPRVYSEDFLNRAENLLNEAASKVEGASEIYRKRIEFVRAGLEVTRLMLDTIPVMTRVRESGGSDKEALEQADANWEKIKDICRQTHQYAVNYQRLISRMEGGYRGGVQDYFGPPSEKLRKGPEASKSAVLSSKAQAAPMRPAPADRSKASREAEEGGWELVFHDDFERDELGENWRAMDGHWTVEGGAVSGSGLLIYEIGFPGFQRLEFEASTDVKPLAFLGTQAEKSVQVCDLSSFVQARLDDNARATRTGYFFQFGGFMNTMNQLWRSGQALCADEDPQHMIKLGKRHRIVVENDEGHLRFAVDGELLLEHTEPASIVGAEQDLFGFYFLTVGKIHRVRLYTKPLKDDFI